jgi:hypothetical protein
MATKASDWFNICKLDGMKPNSPWVGLYKIKEDLTIFNTTRKNIDRNVESM